MTDAQDEIKQYVKERTSGKGNSTFVFIKVREIKNLENLKIKDEGKGVVELRVHTKDKKLPNWYTHAYLINLQNFNLTLKEIKDKRQLQEILLNPRGVTNPDPSADIREVRKRFWWVSA